MRRELRPEFCTGVGICASHKKNDSHTYYQIDLWSTHKTNTDDNSLIMRVGIVAMYNEVCRLLEELKRILLPSRSITANSLITAMNKK